MLQGVKNFFSKIGRKSQTFRLFMSGLNVTPSFREADYKKFVEEAYEQNPYVYSTITQIANSAAGIPPQLYEVSENGAVDEAQDSFQRKGHSPRREKRLKRQIIENVRHQVAAKHVMDYGVPYHISRKLATKALVQSGELEPVEGHEILDVLLYPNDWYQRSYQQFIQAFVTHLEIGGESFIEPVEGTDGVPMDLFVLPPKGVKFNRGTDDHPIASIEFQGRSQDEYFYSPDPMETEIFYSRYYNPLNPLRGLSPMEAARYSIDVNNEGRSWNLGLLQNGAAHSGIVSAKGEMSPGQVDSIKKRFNRRYQGAENAGKIVALDELEGLDFTPVTQSVKDMQWGDLNKMSALECSIVWNVPPEILGHDESKTFANYEEARKAFYMEKIIPLMDFVYGELNTSIVPRFESNRTLWLDYDAEAVDALRDDVNELHERIRKDVEAGLLQINEGRAAIGHDDVDGGNVILVDVRKSPLSTATQGPEDQPPQDEDEEEEEENDFVVNEDRMLRFIETGMENGSI